MIQLAVPLCPVFSLIRLMQKEMLFEEKKAAYGASRLSVGVMGTIYPCHLRGGESADMTRQVVSTENREL